MRRLISSLQRRFDLVAVEQLRAEVLRLAEENADLDQRLTITQHQLSHAESLAEAWREDAFDAMQQLVEATGGTAALHQDGRLSCKTPAEARL